MSNFSYTIVLEPAEEGGYTVTVPALPAIVTEGDTYEEAVAMAKDAIAVYLRSLAAAGRPIPTEDSPSGVRMLKIEVAAPATS